MARKAKEVAKENIDEHTLYRVTSKGDKAIFLNGKIIMFNDKLQAIVTKEEYEKLAEMGVIQ